MGGGPQHLGPSQIYLAWFVDVTTASTTTGAPYHTACRRSQARTGPYQPAEAPSWQALGGPFTITGTLTWLLVPPAQTVCVTPAPEMAPA